jgi:biotin carboxylase
VPGSTPHLLLFAATTGYQLRVFAEAARRLGVDLTLATDRCHVLEDPWGDRAIPVRFDQPEWSMEQLRATGFDGVVALGERPAVLAAQAAEALGVPFHPPASVRACHDKNLARGLLQAAGLPVPAYFRAALDDDPRELARRAPFPCVLKPLGLSASRGVIRADGPAEFIAAFERIRALLARPEVRVTREELNRYVQVESYIEGREFAVEGILTRGRLQVLALFDKPDPLEGPFFEETIYTTPSREEPAAQRAMLETTERACRALGLRHGPLHAELRWNRQGAWMLEAAARPIGGLCAKALRFHLAGTTMPLEELVLRHACGQDVGAATPADAASGVMMIPIPRRGIYEGVSGMEQAGAVPGIEEVILTAKEGQELLPLPEGASYLGFIFARGETPAAVERSLRESHQCLEFRLSTVLPTLRP